MKRLSEVGYIKLFCQVLKAEQSITSSGLQQVTNKVPLEKPQEYWLNLACHYKSLAFDIIKQCLGKCILNLTLIIQSKHKDITGGKRWSFVCVNPHLTFKPLTQMCRPEGHTWLSSCCYCFPIKRLHLSVYVCCDDNGRETFWCFNTCAQAKRL